MTFLMRNISFSQRKGPMLLLAKFACFTGSLAILATKLLQWVQYFRFSLPNCT